ncbi:MAG: helicase-related protein, partial [Nanoarchaeota archaeon]
MAKFIYEDWFTPTETNYIIHCGKTGSGKTFNAIKRLKEVGSGVYLAPLRLLAWEIYEKLNSEGFRCDLVTGEEQIIGSNSKIISCTIEMLNYSHEHEVVIIDEAFMLGDRDRGKSWLKAIIKAKAKEVHIITSEESLELIKQILSITGRKHEVVNYEMLQQFTFTETKFVTSTKMAHRGVFFTFSRMDVLINKLKLENLGYNVSILYGNLPPEVKKKQIELFVSGINDLMVCTDVIGMGINIPCDYIVFLNNEKFDGEKVRKLTPT